VTARAGAPAAIALAGGALLFFAPGVFFGKVPIYRDLLVLVLPLRIHTAAAVRAGELPLWTRDLFLGAPLLADYQSAVLYPPSLLLYALPIPVGFSLYLAFHLFVAGAGMERFLRRRLGASPPAAAFGGVVFAFGGFVTSLVPLTNHLQVAAWLPWALDAADEWSRDGERRALLRLTAADVLVLLGGAPESALLTLVLAAAVAARAAPRSPAGAARLGAVAGTALLAASISAVQLLPTLAYAARTDRADVLPFASVAAESLRPVSLTQLLLPPVFRDGAPPLVPGGGVPLFWSIYLGIPGLVLAIAGALAGRRIFWLAVLGISVALALGEHLPLLRFLYATFPGPVGAFRFPMKFFLLAHLALAVIAADGLDRCGRAGGRPAIAVATAVAAGAAAVALAAWTAPEGLLRILDYPLKHGAPPAVYAHVAGTVAAVAMRSAAIAVAVAVVLWLWQRGRLTAGAAALAFAVLAFLDLTAVHQPTLVFTPWATLHASADATALGASPGQRIFHYCTAVPGCLPPGAAGLGPWSGAITAGEDVEPRGRELWAALVPNVPMVYGLGAVAGSDGFTTREQHEVFRTLALAPRDGAVRLLAALGVERLVGREDLARELPPDTLDPAAATTSRRAYGIPGAAPRSYVAERVWTAADVRESVGLLAAASFRPGRDAVLIHPAHPLTSAGGGVRDATYGTEHVAARVSLTTPGLWVVNDSWDPGWKGSVDGAPVEVLRVNGVVRGLSVPSGDHDVEMSYRPREFRIGASISGLGILAAGALAAWARRAGSRRRTSGS
jgi:hypothetical protein